ncbi:LysR family transcriptional regulator [Pseudonocardia kongjuensis]|uniref:LysR family transcriptional regulator n=1 Tax=Pseudonocardia kongjuensis TaxID=102227 RepID=A0ABP4IN68_9PSEU
MREESAVPDPSGRVTIDPRISLQKLEILCLVVELGGVHAAADRLFVSQPVVSAHLKLLQQRVGLELLTRRGHRLVLTEAGRHVHAWAQEVLSRRSALERDLGDLAAGRGGTVTVAASMTVGSFHLPPVLTAFGRSRPDARVTLLVSDPESALRRTETGECDFAVLVTDQPVDPALFEGEQVGEDEFVLVAAPDSDLPDELPVAALGGIPAVCPPPNVAVRRLQDAELRLAGLAGRPIGMELGSAEAIKHAVAGGLGVALLSRAVVAADLAAGVLREIRLRGVRLRHPVTLVRRRDRRLTPVQRQLTEEIARKLSPGQDNRL